MSDLSIAILIVGGLCFLTFRGGSRVSRYRSSRVRGFIQLSVVVLLPLYFAFAWNRPILSQLIPWSGLIVLGNWLPLWASFFLGCYMATESVSLTRRRLLCGFTFALIGYSLAAPRLGSAPQCEVQVDRQGLVYQTTPYTCSAACAASILRLHGIEASEGEMADLCLTREGTHWMGLFRGLKLKTQGTDWTVVAIEYSEDELNALTGPGILAVNVDTSRFEADVDHGFSSHTGHSVVFLGRSPGDGTVVFDPSPDFGMEDWFQPTRSSVRDGVILKLAPRSNSLAQAEPIRARVNQLLQRRRLATGLAQAR